MRDDDDDGDDESAKKRGAFCSNFADGLNAPLATGTIAFSVFHQCSTSEEQWRGRPL